MYHTVSLTYQLLFRVPKQTIKAHFTTFPQLFMTITPNFTTPQAIILWHHNQLMNEVLYIRSSPMLTGTAIRSLSYPQLFTSTCNDQCAMLISNSTVKCESTYITFRQIAASLTKSTQCTSAMFLQFLVMITKRIISFALHNSNRSIRYHQTTKSSSTPYIKYSMLCPPSANSTLTFWPHSPLSHNASLM